MHIFIQIVQCSANYAEQVTSSGDLIGDRLHQSVVWRTGALHDASGLHYELIQFTRRTKCTMGNFRVVDFDSLDETVKRLVREAIIVRKNSYCPYSNFAVGAALLTEEDSKLYTGCNVENAAFGPTICAERCAVPKAVSEGYTKIKCIAIVAQQKDFTAPCGFCRQTLREFCSSDGDMDVYLSKPSMDKVLCTKLSELLPLSFGTFKE